MSAVSIHPTDVECPTCDAWVGWACKGANYGYHAAGYHPSRQRAAEQAAVKKTDPSTETDVQEPLAMSSLEERFAVCSECGAPWKLHWVYVCEKKDADAISRGAQLLRRSYNTCGLTRRQLEAKWITGRLP